MRNADFRSRGEWVFGAEANAEEDDEEKVEEEGEDRA
jgi:hypothetical protein